MPAYTDGGCGKKGAPKHVDAEVRAAAPEVRLAAE